MYSSKFNFIFISPPINTTQENIDRKIKRIIELITCFEKLGKNKESRLVLDCCSILKDMVNNLEKGSLGGKLISFTMLGPIDMDLDNILDTNNNDSEYYAIRINCEFSYASKRISQEKTFMIPKELYFYCKNMLPRDNSKKFLLKLSEMESSLEDSFIENFFSMEDQKIRSGILSSWVIIAKDQEYLLQIKNAINELRIILARKNQEKLKNTLNNEEANQTIIKEIISELEKSTESYSRAISEMELTPKLAFL